MNAVDNGIEKRWVCTKCPGVSETVSGQDLLLHDKAVRNGGKQNGNN